jgi:hypothetical protein
MPAPLEFRQLIWLMPIVVLLHVIEELPRFPAWATRALRLPYTRRKFVWENIVLFAILLASVALAAFWPVTTLAGQAGLVLVLSAAVSLFSNTIFHALLTLRTGIYSPGTVTACLLFPPLSIGVYYQAAVEGLLTIPVVGLSIVVGLAMLPIVIAIVHRTLDGKIRGRTLVKIGLMGVLPPLVLGAATAVFEPQIVHKIMIYAGPLALLPLVLKWAMRRTTAQDRPRRAAGSAKGTDR